jgi:L-fuculose-phosphate aldolase
LAVNRLREDIMNAEQGQVISSLTARQELAILLRLLAREGYDEHVAGHISYLQPDGTLLVNPFELLWEEVCASDIMRVGSDGQFIEGKWTVSPAVRLHVELHKVRHDVTVAIHNHSRWGTIWAGLGRIPRVYDQTSAFIAEEIAFIDEYGGSVHEESAARAIAEAVGDIGCILLKNHGPLVIAGSIKQAHMRALALESRCRVAWHVEAVGGGTPMASVMAAGLNRVVDTVKMGALGHLWDMLVRRELRFDRSVLD